MLETIIEFVAGGVSGAVAVFLGHPLDFVKIRLQSSVGTYAGPLDCFAQAVRREGPLSVFRGVLPPMLNSVVLSGTLFGGYGHGKRLFGDRGLGLSDTRLTFCAGAYAGLLTSFTTTPFDLVKCQLQVDRAGGRVGRYRNGAACVRAILAREGPRGLYRGGLVTAIRASPMFGLYFVLFEHLERELPSMLPRLAAGEAATMWAGGLSGMATWAIAYPLDTVKSHLQTLPLERSACSQTISHAMHSIYARHGAAHFYRGLGTCLIRAFPVNAIVFVVYGRLKGLMATAGGIRCATPAGAAQSC